MFLQDELVNRSWTFHEADTYDINNTDYTFVEGVFGSTIFF